MYQLFSILAVICLVMLVISLIRPRWGTFGKKPEWKRKKLCPAYFSLFIVFGLLCNYTMPEDVRLKYQQEHAQRENQKQLEEQQKQENEQLKAEKKKQAEEEKAIAEEEKKNIFCRNYGLTLDQAHTIEAVLDEVGLSKVLDTTKEGDYIKLNVEAKDDNYTPKKGAVKIFLDADNNLQSIKIGSLDLYSNGQVVRQISDVLISYKDETIAESMSEEMVKQVLKAPSTAKFDEGTFKYYKQDGIVTTIGTVDAQNSFGAMVRTKFKIQYDSNDGMKPVHFTFGDQDVF